MRFHILGIPHTVTNIKYVSCYSDDTEIMTEDGWTSLKYLCENNIKIRVATLNPNKDIIEYHYPKEWVVNEYKGLMFHQDSQSIDLLVTPEHRLWARTACKKRLNNPFQLIEANKTPRVMQYRRDFPWREGKEIQTFTLPEYNFQKHRKNKIRPSRIFPMDKWLRIFGIYIAEGNIDGTIYTTKSGEKRGGCYSVCIAQEKSKSRQIIKKWIDDLDLRFYSEDKQGFRIHDVQIATWFKQFGTARHKFIPKEWKNLSKRQLSVLLDALMLGDGWSYSTGNRYVTYSLQLANDVAEICLKLGYSVTQFDDKNPKTPRHIVTFSNHQKRPLLNNKVDHRKYIPYHGKVYCLKVQNHIVYVRRNGKSCFSGNCAYSQKILKLCKMLYDLGHEVYHYGCEGSNPVCTEHIDVITEAFRSEYYSTDFRIQQFKFNQKDKCYLTFHENATREIRKRLGDRDFLLCMWGWGHQPVAKALENELMVVEPGIGYPDIFSKFRVFESYTWMSFVYGKYSVQDHKYNDGAFNDAVIPNYFDPNDFTYNDKKEDWFLYLGRFVKRKGIDVASQVVKAIGGKLVMAGQGQLCDANEGINIQGDHIENAGFADVDKRKDLLSRAKAVFMPTYYIEPFGGVSIEAFLSGTPVISTDWGVFAENNLHGITGYRCRTFEQFCWAARNIQNISPAACREWAIQNFTLERVAQMYQEYFEMLDSLRDKEGWYKPNDHRENLDWLNKRYPTCI